MTEFSAGRERPWISVSVLIGLAAATAMLTVNWAFVPLYVRLLETMFAGAGVATKPLSATNLAVDLALSFLCAFLLMRLVQKRPRPHGIAIASFMMIAGWAVYFAEVGYFQGMSRSAYGLWYEVLSFVKYPAALAASIAWSIAFPTTPVHRGPLKASAHVAIVLAAALALLGAGLAMALAYYLAIEARFLGYPDWTRAAAPLLMVGAIPVAVAAIWSFVRVLAPRRDSPSGDGIVNRWSPTACWIGAGAWLLLGAVFLAAAFNGALPGFGVAPSRHKTLALVACAFPCFVMSALLIGRRFLWSTRRMAWIAAGVLVLLAAVPVAVGVSPAGRLQRAIVAGDLPKVQALVKAGADVNAAPFGGVRPLAQAVQDGKYVIAEALLRAGADPNERVGYIDVLFLLPAIGPRCPASLVRALLVAGRDPSATVEFESVLSTALTFGANECATVLLDAGADVHYTNGNGMTILHDAVGGASSGLVERLLAAGVPVDAKAKGDVTPLMLAALRRGTDGEGDRIVDLLLSHGADPCLRETRGPSAGDLARRAGMTERAERLAALCRGR